MSSLKRKGVGGVGECQMCPVCLEAFGDGVTKVCSFACDHGVCDRCDVKLFARCQHRCPLCRRHRSAASYVSHAQTPLVHEEPAAARHIFFPRVTSGFETVTEAADGTELSEDTGLAVFSVFAALRERPRRHQPPPPATTEVDAVDGAEDGADTFAGVAGFLNGRQTRSLVHALTDLPRTSTALFRRMAQRRPDA